MKHSDFTGDRSEKNPFWSISFEAKSNAWISCDWDLSERERKRERERERERERKTHC